LESLSDPTWDAGFQHPVFSNMATKMVLSNWLAYDYLHLRQITKLKYDFLKYLAGENLEYEDNW
jgi:hypothetical protein